jgi:hypothetical protein
MFTKHHQPDNEFTQVDKYYNGAKYVRFVKESLPFSGKRPKMHFHNELANFICYLKETELLIEGNTAILSSYGEIMELVRWVPSSQFMAQVSLPACNRNLSINSDHCRTVSVTYRGSDDDGFPQLMIGQCQSKHLKGQERCDYHHNYGDDNILQTTKTTIMDDDVKAFRDFSIECIREEFAAFRTLNYNQLPPGHFETLCPNFCQLRFITGNPNTLRTRFHNLGTKLEELYQHLPKLAPPGPKSAPPGSPVDYEHKYRELVKEVKLIYKKERGAKGEKRGEGEMGVKKEPPTN